MVETDREAVALTCRPLLSERYGPDNPGATEEERNLFAAGALWGAEHAVDRVLERWRLVPVDASSYVEVDPLRVDCPACGRRAGEPCFRVSEMGDGRGMEHFARINAANAAAAQRP